MHPVMTLTEASRFLRLRTGQVSALAQNGSLPAFQVDGKWRFMKSALEEWMMQNEGANLESTGGGESNAA
ncbi:MAG: helix-turn-helix domain-containing protein [Armatimonadetes bacterium]|nr:helix-turn-helix domain-containing protein [Armatimonadota bacterium]